MDSGSPRSSLDEGEIGDDESRVFDDGYDENLMGDEEDRRRLAQMTEKEREQELFNRSERRETLRIRFEIKMKLKKAKKREAEKKQTKQVRAKKRMRVSEVFSDSDEDSDEYKPESDKSGGSNELNISNKPGTKMNTRSKVLISSSSSSASSASESGSSASSSASSDSERDDNDDSEAEDTSRQQIQDDFQMSLADLKQLQLKRDQIDKWIYAPFFKQTAIGMFVKISIANNAETQAHMYRVAQIVDITQGPKIYSLGKHKTDKQCTVKIGRVERTYAMHYISNRSFDEDDFTRWREQNRAENLETPTREYFNMKKRELYKAINYIYTDEDIAQEVRARVKFNENPFNFAMKKTEMLAQKADAEASNDYEEAARLQKLIDELEEKARQLEKTRSSTTFSAISFVNERNRIKNIEESERVLKESKSVRTDDPFTRRKCTPSIVHNRNNGDLLANKSANDKNNQSNSQNGAGNSSINKTPSLPKVESVESVNDLFQAHASIDLELDI